MVGSDRMSYRDMLLLITICGEHGFTIAALA
jgi:hypothetical protein